MHTHLASGRTRVPSQERANLVISLLNVSAISGHYRSTLSVPVWGEACDYCTKGRVMPHLSLN